jgi:4-diphosphocytidyl-2C-methyl-D-erythritol kinase
MGIKEYAYAKLNLHLNIVKKRKDGFHDLEMINIPINFYDTLSLSINNENKDILIKDYDIEDNKDIVYKTISLFKSTYNIKDNVTVKIHKTVPIGAGLGSASALSSAVLRGLNKLFNFENNIENLEKLASKLGSDNLFCLYNKAAYVYGKGDKILFIDDIKYIKTILLILPNDLSVSTKEVFDNYIVKKPYSSVKIVKSILNGNYKYFEKNRYNSLTKTTIKLNKKLSKISKLSKNIQMSGSGSAFFIVNPTLKEISKINNKQTKLLYTVKNVTKKS